MINKLFRTTLILTVIFFGLPASPANAAKHPPASTPVNIKISAIGVSAKVEGRGLTWRGLMRPPTTAKKVAWDRTGTIPGQPGEAVMYGHLTDSSFRPAIFANLHKLKIDHRVIVTDKYGTTHTFKVTKTRTIPSDQISYFDISQDTKYIRLNLYTCAGKWQPRYQRYSHYTVVYTALISSIPRQK